MAQPPLWHARFRGTQWARDSRGILCVGVRAVVNPPRVSFEFTIDEAVEFQLSYLRSFREGGSWRRREQGMFFATTFALAAGAVLLSHRDLPWTVTLGSVLLVALLAGLLALPFGWWYDHLVRRRIRRLLVEQHGGEGPHGCTIEIRSDGLWVDQHGVQMLFPWHEAQGLDDAPAGITATFRGGCVLVRRRGFGSEAERQAFLRRARELTAEAVHRPTPDIS